MYCIASLNLVCAQRLGILHNSTRIDQAHPIHSHVLEVTPRELSLEVEDGGALGYGDSMLAIAGGLHLKGHLVVGDRGVFCGHAVLYSPTAA